MASDNPSDGCLPGCLGMVAIMFFVFLITMTIYNGLQEDLNEIRHDMEDTECRLAQMVFEHEQQMEELHQMLREMKDARADPDRRARSSRLFQSPLRFRPRRLEDQSGADRQWVPQNLPGNGP